jgi:hypothetical protein
MTTYVDALVNRFLAWPLPASVCADPCASMRDYPNRTGTNLLTADEAGQMIQHVLAGELDYRAFCESRSPEDGPDGTLESLATVATMLETYGPECFPANEQGQVDFARSMMDSAAEEIRAFIAKQPPQGDGTQDPSNVN